MNLRPVIGLEIHVQLATKSKLFSPSSNQGEDEPPNTTINAIDLGHPGTLPVVNVTAVDWAVKTALALNCEINSPSWFERKNYFYPDLPKGYQISQNEAPIGKRGWYPLEVAEDRERRVRINRLHLEEDAAKSHHDPQTNKTLLDFNRAGTPLIEIVTEADFHDPAEVKLFLTDLRLMVRYLKISDGDMEKGHLRCDANISLQPEGDDTLYPKTEIKNLNSFRAVEYALRHEIERQSAVWEQGTKPEHATRSWDERKRRTVSMRTKESMADYRYLPDPDLPPLQFDPAHLERIEVVTDELPYFKRKRFRTQYGFSFDDAQRIVASAAVSNYVEHVVSELRAWLKTENPKDASVRWHEERSVYAKLIASWLLNKLTPLLHEHGQHFADTKVTEENFAEFVKLIAQKRLNAKAATMVLEDMVTKGADPSVVIEEKELGQLTDESLIGDIVDRVLKENVESVQDYKAGKDKALQYLMGQIMKETKGKADPKTINAILVHKLK